MNINLRLAVLDVVRQVPGILPKGFGLDNSQLRDADCDIATKINQPVKATLAVLKVKDVDLRVLQPAPHTLPEIPGILYTEDLLTVDLNTGGRDPVLLHKGNQLVLPLGQGFPGLPLVLALAEHQGKEAAVLNDVAVLPILHLDNVVRRQSEICVRRFIHDILVAGIQAVPGLCGTQGGIENLLPVTAGKVNLDVAIEQSRHPRNHPPAPYRPTL